MSLTSSSCLTLAGQEAFRLDTLFGIVICIKEKKKKKGREFIK